ncbi:MICOS complex subunit MIC60 [Parabacteroides sp. OttesenSCG-928-G06]|nr:MICOS complex subunit MIC60 [Parabacteroides sp. OttesenSCG-928-K15]MDL2281533.1 MICOS complex subunit MIC60 [Parabacteroides sp. OttesenSCG-928-G06]
MKKILLVCLLMVMGTVGMVAQQDMQARMKERVENYVKELKLEGEKAEKFKEIQNKYMEKMRTEMQTMRDAGNTDREAMRTKMTKMNEDRDAEIKKILTEEEFKKYQEILSKEPQRGQRRN